MRNLFLLIIFIAGLSFSAFAQNKLKTIEIKTSAICDMCKETIERAMAYEKGIKDYKLDVESKILKVTYKTDKTNPDAIRKAVSAVGYDADNVKANPEAYKKLEACCRKGSSCEEPEHKKADKHHEHAKPKEEPGHEGHGH